MDGRYAPSPTGDLHLGNLRTAVIAHRMARDAGSRFLVRMEDLDYGRVRVGVAERQLEDLAAVGVTWDGPVVFQSERIALYEEALARLDTYDCFCTRAEIREAPSAPHAPPGTYPGTCRDLTPAQRDRKRAAGRPPALRVRAGGVDERVDDFVVRRNDGAFAYNLAVVVDDHDQGLEQVVRGADLADSTPRQVWLARALGFPPPQHVHVGLVLGPDMQRLAKRHGAVTLRDIGPDRAREWVERSLAVPLEEPVVFRQNQV
jgi:glutamyl-tRNA synthetase